MTITWQQFCKALERKGKVAGTESQKIIVTADHGQSPDEPHRLNATYWSEPVCLEHVVFKVAVDLSELVFESSLRIESCRFLHGLKLAHTRVDGLLSLRDSVFDDPVHGWLDWRSLEVDKIFACTGIHSNVCLHLANARFQDDVLFNAATVQTPLTSPAVADMFAANHTNWDDKELTRFLVGCAISMEGCSIDGNLYLDSQGTQRVIIHGFLDLRIRVKGSIQCSGVDLSIEGLDMSHGKAFVCERAEIGGNVSFQPGGHDANNTKYRFECLGEIDLRGNIGGQVNFSGVFLSVKEIAQANGMSIQCMGAMIRGSVLFEPGAQNETTNYRFISHGKINLRCQVGRYVSFNGAFVSAAGLQAAKGVAIDCDGAKIIESIFLQPGRRDAKIDDPFEAVGQIDLRCRVGNQVNVKGARISVKNLKDAKGTALTLAGAAVDEDAFFIDAANSGKTPFYFTVDGSIDLRATFGGLVVFAGVSVHAVDLQGARIAKEIVVGYPRQPKRCEFEDYFNLRYATARSVSLYGCDFSSTVDFSYAELANDLLCKGSSVFKGQLNLVHAIVNGNVTLGDGEIFNKTRMNGLDASHALIHGDLNAKNVASAVENARAPWQLSFVRIEGNAELNGASISGDLILEDAIIDGEMNLSSTQIEGSLRMRSSKVAGRVFGNETGSSSDQPYPKVKKTVDLSFSRLSQVAIAIEKKPGDYTPDAVILTGTVADSFSVRRSQPASSQMTLAAALFGSIGELIKRTDRPGARPTAATSLSFMSMDFQRRALISKASPQSGSHASRLKIISGICLPVRSLPRRCLCLVFQHGLP